MRNFQGIVFMCILSHLQICISVPLTSFLRLFTETITPERKRFFSKLHANIVKIDKIR